jgi:thiol-disulfide isomerase/thioredoxin
MMATLPLGPLALPLSPLLLGLSAWLALVLGQRLGRRAGVDAQPVLLRMLLFGLLGARLGFVWPWRSSYLHDPLSILDIRDGGWEPVAGCAAALLIGLVQAQRQPGLRKPVLAAALLLMSLSTAGEVALAAFADPPHRPLPAISLPDLAGRPVALASYAGKPTVLNLWATWCPPCRREMPLLQRAQAAHPEVHIVFVNQGEARADVLRYLQGQGLTLHNVLLDARRATGAAFQEQALPTTLFFDARGQLVSTRIGALSESTLAQRIATLHPAVPAPEAPVPQPK